MAKKLKPKKAAKAVKKGKPSPKKSKTVSSGKKPTATKNKKSVAKKAALKKVSKPAGKAVVKKKTPAKKQKPVKAVKAKAAVKKVTVKVVNKKAAAAKKPVQKTKLLKTAQAKPDMQIKSSAKLVPVKPAAKSVKAVVEKPKAVAATAPVKSTVKRKAPERTIDFEEEEQLVSEKPVPHIIVDIGATIQQRLRKPQPPPQINKDTRTRYSDKELKEFKELIHFKLLEATKDYELLKSTLSHKDDHGTDDTSPTFKLLEDGSDVLTKEETAHLAQRQEKFIQNLQNALVRIENKTYGICRVTGKLISKERLRSVPHATLGIDAKLVQAVE